MGNDRLQAYGIERQEKFQSTFPRGERRLSYEATSRDMSISIHVPSWGTTGDFARTSGSWAFQSTFPRGERHSVGDSLSVLNDFNPRSLVGNDGKFSQIFFFFLCNKYNFSTFYYPFSLFFSVIHVTFLIFVVRILPAFYVYF